MALPTTLGPNDRRFFSLEYMPIAPPFADPDNAGFFRLYTDLSF